MSAAFSHPHSHYTTHDNKTAPTSASPASGGPRKEDQELVADAPPVPAPESAGAIEVAPKPRRPRGFAAMDRTLVSEIARKGGKAAHTAGTAHEFTTEEARAAGRKGGRATHAKRRARTDVGSEPSVERAREGGHEGEGQ